MDHIASHIPFLRRYARALTGNQVTGDAYVAAVLEAMIAAPETVPTVDRARIEVFAMFHGIWHSSGAPVNDTERGKAAKVQEHLDRLTAFTREAVLLHAMEDFPAAQVADIMSVPLEEAENLIRIGQEELANSARGSVLIIEDEPVIALDLETIVTDAGHAVFGVAATHAEAVRIAAKERPDLILADIRLADDSSGIDAVNALLAAHGEVPVIFITAFPERLLTGDKPEPAFLITKPFRTQQVLSAISQALFFASTEVLA